LTQGKPNDRYRAADTAIEAMRRAKMARSDLLNNGRHQEACESIWTGRPSRS
jgi:hypothetical protein